jgi:hypothetical protein
LPCPTESDRTKATFNDTAKFIKAIAVYERWQGRHK